MFFLLCDFFSFCLFVFSMLINFGLRKKDLMGRENERKKDLKVRENEREQVTEVIGWLFLVG